MSQYSIAKNNINKQWKQRIQQRGIQIIVGFFVLVACLVGGPATQAAKPIYPLDQLECETCNPYQLDFLYLVKLLQDSHPNVYANFPKEEFEQEKARILAELETTEDRVTCALLLQQFCARIGDAHTKIKYSDVIQTSRQIFPVGFTVLQDDFYLTMFDTSVDMEFLGAKILEVNGMLMPQVIQKLGCLVSCENDICRKREVSHLLQQPRILQFMQIVGDNAPLTLTVITPDGTKHPICIPATAKRAVRWADIYSKEHPITAKKHTWFSYRIFPEKQICYFQFNRFLDRQTLRFYKQQMMIPGQFERLFGHYPTSLNQHFDFRYFLQQMFAEIQQKHIPSLIIDLRYNGGGNSTLGRQIMYCLQGVPDRLKGYVEGIKFSPLMQDQYPEMFEQEKQRYEDHYGKDTLTLPNYVGDMSAYKDVPSPEDRIYRRTQFFQKIEEQDSILSVFYMAPLNTRFSGKVFLLIGSGTFSAASDFATEMSDNQLATLVGQPIGQKPSSFGDCLFFQLPHTNIEGTISYKMCYRPDATKDDDPTLYPDVEVWPMIDDILNGNDPVFDTVLELFTQQKDNPTNL